VNHSQLNHLETGSPITWTHPRTGEPHNCVFSDVRLNWVRFWFADEKDQTEDNLCAVTLKEARQQLKAMEA